MSGACGNPFLPGAPEALQVVVMPVDDPADVFTVSRTHRLRDLGRLRNRSRLLRAHEQTGRQLFTPGTVAGPQLKGHIALEHSLRIFVGDSINNLRAMQSYLQGQPCSMIFLHLGPAVLIPNPSTLCRGT